MKTYFKLYAYNIPVKGASRAAIYNLQFKRIRLIPVSLYEILQETAQHPYEEIRSFYEGDDQQTFDSYFELLQAEGLGFFTTTPECFPKMSLEWKYPGLLQSCVLEYPFIKDNTTSLIPHLAAMGCRFMEVQLHTYSAAMLEKLLNSANGTIFRCINLVIDYHPDMKEDFLISLIDRYRKIGKIHIYNAPQSGKQAGGNIIYSVRGINNIFPLNSYHVNLSFFTESLSYNTYYNKKVCISRNGDIKNCLSHAQSFGNVNTDDIAAIVNSKEFQQLWHVSPDKITDLRDSEMRYAIYTTAALQQNNDGTYSITR
ncbi:SPASM domain peptide maturase of grasp-with-spasm system [Chitinophaga niastensis]|uniref:SPASM domain peptide maturase of grasp-with-spasm system n=1 Tax=Chitinophaga niastensis TaxID=536980 RepID=A0A2P8HEK1_CHINA|nr:SPASM domain-containing protein [Chitinophaga niastensis]PSL44652.1 SPASM domain peptide maturase of grasp-with-spasm system [Chitinophaga niastensis]